jgi:hypothetical protein
MNNSQQSKTQEQLQKAAEALKTLFKLPLPI